MFNRTEPLTYLPSRSPLLLDESTYNVILDTALREIEENMSKYKE